MKMSRDRIVEGLFQVLYCIEFKVYMIDRYWNIDNKVFCDWKGASVILISFTYCILYWYFRRYYISVAMNEGAI